ATLKVQSPAKVGPGGSPPPSPIPGASFPPKPRQGARQTMAPQPVRKTTQPRMITASRARMSMARCVAGKAPARISAQANRHMTNRTSRIIKSISGALRGEQGAEFLTGRQGFRTEQRAVVLPHCLGTAPPGDLEIAGVALDAHEAAAGLHAR